MGRLRIIDLSVPIEAVPSEFVIPEIEHEDHKKGANLMKWVFGVEDSDLPYDKTADAHRNPSRRPMALSSRV